MTYSRSRQARVRQGYGKYWYLFHSRFDGAVWSGVTWVECNLEGYPIGNNPVCKFMNQDQAVRYALEHGFDTVAVSR